MDRPGHGEVSLPIRKWGRGKIEQSDGETLKGLRTAKMKIHLHLHVVNWNSVYNMCLPAMVYRKNVKQRIMHKILIGIVTSQ